VSTPAGYFEDMYAAEADPWHLASRWYEQRKHALTVGVLTRDRYACAFEPGCSVGALTALLAPRCDRLLATDRVPAALAEARRRLGDVPGLRLEPMAVPGEFPRERFDLVVLSEIGYYLDEPGLDRLVTATRASLEPGGELVAAHWRHPVPDHALTGDGVHDRLGAAEGLRRVSRHEEADFLLEVFVRVPPEPSSVAEREGLC